MLHVKTPEEVLGIIRKMFTQTARMSESVELRDAVGRTLFNNVIADEYVPDFNRSTVDGFAVSARDTFGSSESIPAILPLAGEVAMGQSAAQPLEKGTCLTVPTGGDVPDGADAVVMLEYAEDYGDGTIGIIKPVAPGENIIFRGDDVSPGTVLLQTGRLITPHDIGSLAALGINTITVCKMPVVGILSTGDELVDFSLTPEKGQIRDVNSVMLEALIQTNGGLARSYGIIRDSVSELDDAVLSAVSDCDIVLISGGSSVGIKDATAGILEKNGRVLFHGIAMKPGKPTLLGIISGKPVFGLPGHPVAAYFVTQLFVCPTLDLLAGRTTKHFSINARLGESVSANHGRAEYLGVALVGDTDIATAYPIHGKSGLITTLSQSDGYICIPRDCEGFSKDTTVAVTLWNK